MKKSLLLLLALILALSIAGCSSSKATEAAPPADIPEESPPSAVPPTDVPAPTDLPPTATEEPAPTERPTPSGPMEVSSTSFENEGQIALKYGIPPFDVPYHDHNFVCEGTESEKENMSPALTWTNIPLETESLAIVMLDIMSYAYPQLPPEAVFSHWLIYNLPPIEGELPEATPGELALPEGAVLGNNNYPEEFRTGYGGPCPPRGEEHQYIITLYALDTTIELPADNNRYSAFAEAIEGHVIAESQWVGYYTNQ